MPDSNTCPRCQGRLFGNGDVYGEYKECLQCGHVIYVESVRLDLVVVRGRQKPGRPKKRGGPTAV